MPVSAQVLSWLFYLSFMVYTMSILYLLRLRPITNLSIGLSALLSLLALWALAASFSTIAPTLSIALLMRKASSLGWGVVYSLVLHITMIFTRREAALNKKWLICAIYLPSVLNLIVFLGSDQHFHLALTEWGWTSLWVDTFWNYFHMTYYLVYGIISLYLVLSWWRRAEQPAEKKQARLVSGTFLLATVLSIFSDTLIASITGGQSPQLTVIFLSLPTAGIILAIKRHGFLQTPALTATPRTGIILNDQARAKVYTHNGFMVYLMAFVNLAFRVLVSGEFSGPAFWLGGLGLSLLILSGGFLILNAQLFNWSVRKQETLLTLVTGTLITASIIAYSHTGALTVWSLIFPFLITSVVYNNIRIMLIAATIQILIQVTLLFVLGPGLVHMGVIDYLVRILSIGYSAYAMRAINRIYLARLKESEDKLDLQTTMREITWSLRPDLDIPQETAISAVLKSLAAHLHIQTIWFLTVRDGKIALGIRNNCGASRVDLADAARFSIYDQLPGVDGVIMINQLLTITRDEAEALASSKSYYKKENLDTILIAPIEVSGVERHYLLAEFQQALQDKAQDYGDLLHIASDGLAVYLKQAAAARDLTFLAFHDKKTGLFNQHGFSHAVAQRLKHEKYQAFSLLLIEMGGLQEVKDICGHQLSEKALENIAADLNANLQTGEILGIMQADHFLYLLLVCPQSLYQPVS